MCNRLFLFSFHRCFLRSAPKWSTIYCKLIQGLTGSSWTFLLAVPYRLYVDSLPQASVSGTDVCCCLQSLEGALLPSCLRTRCGSTRGLSTAASIFIWRCSDAFVKGWLPPLIWPLISLYFLSYWVVPQRGCYCRGFSVCTFLKKGMAEGSFQTDLRNSCLGLFQHSLNCTGDYCFYTCIHCIFLFFCLMCVHCTIISWFYLL